MASAALRLVPTPPSDLDVLAEEFARHNPAIAADLGVSIEDLAQLAATSAPIEDAVELGWMSAEDQRFFEGEATLADLRALGYSPDECAVLLAEQRGGACASST